MVIRRRPTTHETYPQPSREIGLMQEVLLCGGWDVTRMSSSNLSNEVDCDPLISKATTRDTVRRDYSLGFPCYKPKQQDNILTLQVPRRRRCWGELIVIVFINFNVVMRDVTSLNFLGFHMQAHGRQLPEITPTLPIYQRKASVFRHLRLNFNLPTFI